MDMVAAALESLPEGHANGGDAVDGHPPQLRLAFMELFSSRSSSASGAVAHSGFRHGASSKTPNE